MGFRTAAANLGFRLAAAASSKKIASSRLSIFPRRCTSSLATTTSSDVKKEKILYLFFEQKSNLIVHPVKLEGYNGDHEEVEELEEAVGSRMFMVSNLWKSCIQLGSKVVFGIGKYTPKDICFIDLSIHPLKNRESSLDNAKIKSVKQRKSRMLWGAIDGKIYCFHNCIDYEESGPPFEVLDPEINNPKWKPLSGPPFIWDGEKCTYEKYRCSALFLNMSKKILVWEYDRSGVFCFDTTKPEKGWVKSPPSLGEFIPFIGYDTRFLVIDEHHPTLGKFNLVLAHDRFDEPFVVQPFFISENCDSYQAIDPLIRLPKDLCSNYRVSYTDAESNLRGRCISFDSEFVHLGDRKFCLVLHEFVKMDYHDHNKTKVNVLVLTYEYDIVVNDDKITEDSMPDLKIKTSLLGIRRFKSCHRKSSPHRLIGGYPN